MARCRKEEVGDAARHRQEERETTETTKVVMVHGSVEHKLRSDTNWPSRRAEGICAGTRRTETCVAPRCVDLSRGSPLTIIICHFGSL